MKTVDIVSVHFTDHFFTDVKAATAGLALLAILIHSINLCQESRHSVLHSAQVIQNILTCQSLTRDTSVIGAL